LVEQMATARWQWLYWQRIETRVLGEASGITLARQISLFDRFSRRQARYERAFLKAYREYQRARVARE